MLESLQCNFLDFQSVTLYIDQCFEDNRDENETCRHWSQQRWLQCLNSCAPFDASCENSCTQAFEVDIASCPCNPKCMDGCPCTGSYECGTVLTTSEPTTTTTTSTTSTTTTSTTTTSTITSTSASTTTTSTTSTTTTTAPITTVTNPGGHYPLSDTHLLIFNPSEIEEQGFMD